MQPAHIRRSRLFAREIKYTPWDGAWTPEGDNSRQRGDGYVAAKKLTHREKSGKRIWTENGTGKAMWVSSRRRDVKVLTSRFEINGLSKKEHPEVELLGFKVDFQSKHEEGKV